MGMAAQGKAKAAKARLAVPAATAMFLVLFLAFLPGAGAARRRRPALGP